MDTQLSKPLLHSTHVMTSVGVTRDTEAARTTTFSRVRLALLLLTLALAPVLTPYLLTPAFAVLHEAPTTHAGPHDGAHAGHPAETPTKDPHVHPHCLRCVLFASSLPASAVVTPSTPFIEEPLQLEVGLPPRPWPNPNVEARAPPYRAHHS